MAGKAGKQDEAPLRLEWMYPEEGEDNPLNWRRHPQAQQDALEALVFGEEGVGWAGAGLLNDRRAEDGWPEEEAVPTFVDGHLRKKLAMAHGGPMPVLVGRWTPAGERKILATLDPIAAMAEAVPEVLDALLAQTDVQSRAVLGVLADLAEEAGASASLVGTGDEEEEGNPAAGPVFTDDEVAQKAFEYFRESGFPYHALPVHVCMQQVNRLAETGMERLLQTTTGYHVADTYHPHRFHASAETRKSPYVAFHDDRLLMKAIRLHLHYCRSVGTDYLSLLNVVGSAQAVSNFRPGFACYMYRRYCNPGDTVLDTSAGYGGRLVGFMASGIAGLYVGIDPNTETHEGNLRMARDLGFEDKVELLPLPAEDVPHEAVAGRCDFAFTSPPYFAKERYGDEETQSYLRYPTGEAWREGFLVPTMALQFAALKPGKAAAVNVADVNVGGRVYPLEKWVREAAERAGFEYVETTRYPMHHRFGANLGDEVVKEPVFVFRKPEEE